MPCSFWWTTGGLLVSLAGVLLLVWFLMPYRVRTRGEISLILAQKDPDEMVEEDRYVRLGHFGLVLVVLGTLAQIYGAYLSARSP